MKNSNKKAFLLIAALFLVLPSVFAQDPPPPLLPPVGLPVDGGIVALLVAGLFYGIKKSLKKK